MATGKIVILGIGGRGCSALQRLAMAELPDTVMTMVVSADKRALSSTAADCSILLGESQTGGRSTGGNATLATQAVQQVADLLRQAFAGADAVFMVTGLGGGTGSGAATAIAALLAELRIPCLVFATLPFDFEGKRKALLAENSIKLFQQHGCAVVLLPNDQLQKALGAKARLEDALDESNRLLLQLLLSLCRMLADSGLINMDFNDFVSVISQPGIAVVGCAAAQKGDDLPMLLQQQLQNPLLQSKRVESASSVLVHLTAGLDFTLEQFEATGLHLAQALPKASLILQGLSIKPDYADELELLLLVCGIVVD